MSVFQNLFPTTKIDIFNEDNQDLNARLFSRLSLLEFSALIFNLFMLIGFIYLGTTIYNGFADYQVYLQAGQGNFVSELGFSRGYYYAYWILPLFTILNQLPYWLGILIWGFLNILGLFIGSRIFGNKSSIVLFTYQSLFMLFMGQIAGVIIGSLGIFWYGLKTEKWFISSVGLLFASTKYHIGGFIALCLLVLIDKPFKHKLQVLIYCGIIVLPSLIIYPNWPIEVFHRVQILPLGDLTDISLWKYLGPIVLIFWIPPLIFRLNNMDRIIVLISTLCFATPYFQAYDLLLLWVFPIGKLALLGNLAYFSVALPLSWQRLLVIIPLAIYIAILIKPIKNLLNSNVGSRE
jgi:hypothetical protein